MRMDLCPLLRSPTFGSTDAVDFDLNAAKLVAEVLNPKVRSLGFTADIQTAFDRDWALSIIFA